MRWIRANKRIPVDKLKSLHHDRKVYFADETQFQGPYVVIHATCLNSHERNTDLTLRLKEKSSKMTRERDSSRGKS